MFPSSLALLEKYVTYISFTTTSSSLTLFSRQARTPVDARSHRYASGATLPCCGFHELRRESDRYFKTHLSLPDADAEQLHQTYYKQYGLAIEGLVRHHKIDPLEYNRQVDDALPLENIIQPDPLLRRLLLDMDKTKVRLWLLTNAYINHGERVVRLLGVDDLFEGITYCDYAAEHMICKPKVEMYEKAMAEAGASSAAACYFVGKSASKHQIPR